MLFGVSVRRQKPVFVPAASLMRLCVPVCGGGFMLYNWFGLSFNAVTVGFRGVVDE